MASPISHGGRDYPDYGVSSLPIAYAYVADLSELAVRLGSPNYFDRRGTQLFTETFDNGLGEWYATTNLAGSYARVRSDYAAYGPYGIELTCGAAVAASAIIQRSLPYPYLSTFGIEYHIKHVIAGTQSVFTLYFYTGVLYRQLSVRIDSTNGVIYYLTSGPAWRSIDISPHYTGVASQFHVIKMRVDIENGNWMTLSVDTDDYNVSQYSIYSVVNADPKRLRFYIASTNTGDGSQTDVIDNIILTLDEPS